MNNSLHTLFAYSAYIVDEAGVHWLYDSQYVEINKLVRMSPLALEHHGNVPNLLVVQRVDDFVALGWDVNSECWVVLCDYSY